MASVWAVSEEVVARLVLEDRVDRLTVLAEVDALHERRHTPELIAVEHELLVADRQPTLQPAGGMEHEVDATHHGRQQRGHRLVRSLGVGQLGAAQSEPPDRNGTPSRRAS